MKSADPRANDFRMRRLLVLAPTALFLFSVSACGNSSAVRNPTATERSTIAAWVQRWWQQAPATDTLRAQGFRPVIVGITVSKRDPAFARVTIEGHAGAAATSQAASLALVRIAGRWTLLIGPGTDDGEAICTSPSPRPLEDLYCTRK